ncbi:hypothetical protein CASFOL_025637 [Castilleja foliolosa]|uniref:COMM domain-containing protein n=1 Tax=Castilleja foliolosa TaxID=1961234 RepID=A0ABD3CRN8_9LAMI
MMLFGETTLSEHLHKLDGVKSEQELENLLQLLWRTRKTGLSDPQKSSLQSLLNIPSPSQLDPLLASLRSLIRNCVHKNIEGDDVLKLLPHNFTMEMKSMLHMLLLKHMSQWKRELSQEQNVLGSFAHLSSSKISGSLLSMRFDPNPLVDGHNRGAPTRITAEENVMSIPQLNLQNDVVPLETLGVKSMTWSVENKSVVPANRVALITLKLQDYTKSPLNETEVKFQLNRDTLDAMLRSMSYISEQLLRSPLDPLLCHYERNKGNNTNDFSSIRSDVYREEMLLT